MNEVQGQGSGNVRHRQRRVIVAIVAVVLGVVAIVGVTVMIGMGGASSGNMSINVGYRDAQLKEPTSVTITYEASGLRTQTYDVTGDGAGSIPISWSVVDSVGTPPMMRLQRDDQDEAARELVGAGCVRWPMAVSGTYRLVIGVGSGSGAVTVAWQEAADCA